MFKHNVKIKVTQNNSSLKYMQLLKLFTLLSNLIHFIMFATLLHLFSLVLIIIQSI